MMDSSVHVVAVASHVPVVVAVEVVSSTSQPITTLLVDRTWLVVVTVAVLPVETPNEVVVKKTVADCVSHDVG